MTASKDLTAKVYSLNSSDSVAATTLAGHRDSVISAFFSDDQETIYTVSKDGALFKWQYATKNAGDEDEGQLSEKDLAMRWRITAKHYFMQDAKVRCAAFHGQSDLLVVGFSSGIFGLYELPDFTMLQSLSISQNDVDFVTINKSGEWIAFGASKLGQLLVWEWQSESYILKQQGHYDSMNALVYSPDGSKIITASDDGKIKVWDVVSGFCIVTFTEHTSAVTGLEFSKRGNVLFSSSLDGSIRAWDLIRYRNFRTFTSAKRIQFSCLAVDPSDEIVCAGSIDDFDIHLWSVRTGHLLDRLSGHDSPVSSLCFANEGGLLASGSWDETVRVWSIFGRSSHVEPLQHQSEVLSVVLRPDSKQLAVSTMDGQIRIWDIEKGKEIGTIDCREDAAGGRYSTDRFTAANSQRSKHFTTLCYSSDGTSLLAGGNSKYICLYDVSNEILLKKFTISRNMALEGTLDQFNSKNMTDTGPLDLVDTTGEASDLEDRIDSTLPGASRGDASARKVRPAIRTTNIQFSPTSRSFSAASTEGLLLYSIDSTFVFDPFDLDIEITVETTLAKLKERDYLTALVMSFRLGEQKLIHRVYESVPLGDLAIIARELPEVYLNRMLKFITSLTDDSSHIEFHLLWIKQLVTSHGRYIISNRNEFSSTMRAIQKFVAEMNKDLNSLTSSNIYLVDFLLGNEFTRDHVDVMDVDENSAENGKGKEGDDSENSEDEEADDDVDDEEGWFGPESRTNGLSNTKSGYNGEAADSSDDQ